MSTLPLLVLLSATPLERPAGVATEQVVVMVSPAPCGGKVVPHTTTVTTAVAWPSRLSIRVAGKSVARAPERGPFEVVLRSVPNPKRRGVGRSAVKGCAPTPVTGEAEVDPGALELVLSIGERVLLEGLGPVDAKRWLFGADGRPSREDTVESLTFDGEALRRALRTNAKAVLAGTLAWSHRVGSLPPQRATLAFTLTVNATIAEARSSSAVEDDDEEEHGADAGAAAPH